MLALGCRAAPKTVVEFVLKDRSRFVGCASRTSASKLARHRALTRFKPFLTEQYCEPVGAFSFQPCIRPHSQHQKTLIG
ncbi:hypothetical protein C1886_07785 [Pseudomonas sp. FW300-N1A1]|nr:hypothetical protein C1886_07785 [Pseudomonas sp. FW300-N1A1]